MKKILIFLVPFVLLTLLVSCNDSNTDDTSGQNDTTSSTGDEDFDSNLQLLSFESVDDNTNLNANTIRYESKLEFNQVKLLSSTNSSDEKKQSVTSDYEEHIKVVATVKNENRYSFIDMVIYRPDVKTFVVYNEGNGNYQCSSNTIYKDNMWITLIEFEIDFSYDFPKNGSIYVESLNFIRVDNKQLKADTRYAKTKEIEYTLLTTVTEKYAYIKDDSKKEISKFKCLDKNITEYSFDDLNEYKIISLDDDAFRDCTKLESLYIPDSVTRFGDNTFAGCVSLKELIIGKGITELTEGILSGCSNLESLTIPFVGKERTNKESQLQYPLGYLFGKTKFDNTYSANQIYYDKSEVTVSSYGFENPQLQEYFIPKSLKNIIITDSEYIPRGAFSRMKEIENLVLPANVSAFGERAFEGLSSGSWPNETGEISNLYFNCSIEKMCTIEYIYGVSGTASPLQYAQNTYYLNEKGATVYNNLKYEIIKDIIIKNTTIISDEAFLKCSNLESVVLSDGVETIGFRAFQCCKNLKYVVVPTTLKKVSDIAFNGNNGLVFYYKGSSLDFSNIVFEDMHNTGTLGTIKKYYYSDEYVSGNYWHYVNGEIVLWNNE